MAYRILVDENLDPRTAGLLRDRGHDAAHVEETLGKGAEDPPIARYARRNDFVLLTNDADFLRPDRREGLQILYCPERYSTVPRTRYAPIESRRSSMNSRRWSPTRQTFPT